MPDNVIPPSNQTVVSDKQLSETMQLPYNDESLTQALLIKNKLNRPNLLLNEYIVLCYWHTGHKIKAVELGNAVIRQIESPKIRQILYSQAIAEHDYDLALYHLQKTGFSRSAILLAQVKVFTNKTFLPLLLIIFVLLATFALAVKLIAQRRKKTATATAHADMQTIVTDIPQIKPAKIEENLPTATKNEVSTPVQSDKIAAVSETTDQEDKEISALAVHPTLLTNSSLLLSDQEILKTFFLSLQISLSQHLIRTISIISASPTTGKAAFVLKLARLFAGDDYKTLMLDCNNTGPFLHEEMSLARSQGISDLTDPTCEISSIFRSSDVAQLYYVTCGMQPGEINNLTESGWELLLDYCRKKYEIILLILPETEILCQNNHMINNSGVLHIGDNSTKKLSDDCLELIKNASNCQFLGSLTDN